MKDVQAPHDWQFLLDIFYYLGRLDVPLYPAFASQEDRKKVLTRALRSGNVPIQGCRDTSLGPTTLERIEAKIDAGTKINISINEITLRKVYDIPANDKWPARKDRLEIALFKQVQADRARVEQWLRGSPRKPLPLGLASERKLRSEESGPGSPFTRTPSFPRRRPGRCPYFGKAPGRSRKRSQRLALV